jgi:hypothetical protein
MTHHTTQSGADTAASVHPGLVVHENICGTGEKFTAVTASLVSDNIAPHTVKRYTAGEKDVHQR